MHVADNGTLTCVQGHRFDAAKQGYYNLLTGRGTGFRADTAAMVQARDDFQSAGHYLKLADAIADAVQRNTARSSTVILDAGAGTGYYLQRAKELTAAKSLAIDISRYALRRCARSEGRPLSLVWDIWQRIPLQDQAVDVILNIFAPRNLPEFHRVMRPEGHLIVVTPLPGHLQELRETIGMLDVGADKADELRKSAHPHFQELESSNITYPMKLSRADVVNAVLMGPSAFHTTREEVEAAASDVTTLTVTARFSLQIFGRLAAAPG